MKTIRIVTQPDKLHGKDTQVFDGQGNDISAAVRRVEVTLDANTVNTARLEVYASVEVEALVEGVTILERKCLHCQGSSVDEGRQRIASRLRFIADNVEQGKITPDSFELEAEWHDQPPTPAGMKRRKPTGRIHLNFDYWTTAIRDLKE